jgi:hypothetical protein
LVIDQVGSLPIRLDHLLGVFTGGFGELGAAQHARHFLGALIPDNAPDAGVGPASGFFLLNYIVMIGESGDLREMGNAENLIVAGQGFEFFADGFGGAPSDAGVYFVEDQSALGSRSAASGFRGKGLPCQIF